MRVLKGEKVLIQVIYVHLDLVFSLISGPAGEFPGSSVLLGKGVPYQTAQRRADFGSLTPTTLVYDKRKKGGRRQKEH